MKDRNRKRQAMCGKMWGVMRNMPSAMLPCTIQRHWRSCPGSMLTWGNPPKTETLIFLHILHLMIPAACNGIYRSSVEGASALAFIRFFVCIWCESARSFRSRGELFISFEVLPVGHGCVALLLCNSVYPLYQGVIGLGQPQSRTSSVAFRPLIIVDWSLNINFEELVEKKNLKRL